MPLLDFIMHLVPIASSWQLCQKNLFPSAVIILAQDMFDPFVVLEGNCHELSLTIVPRDTCCFPIDVYLFGMKMIPGTNKKAASR